MTFICGPAREHLREEHRHETVAEITPRCWGRGAPVPAPAYPRTLPARTAPSAPRVASHGHPTARTDGPSTAQLDYVRDLGGDVAYAAKLTRKQCSEYLDHLEANRTPPKDKRTLDIPFGMLDLIKDGRYATRADANQPYTFFKVSRPTTGRFKGAYKVSTQHSDLWKVAYVHWPSGGESLYRTGIKENLLVLIADQDEAKRVYADEIGACFICGRTLTDERSRWYGIGPDCEIRHPYVIADADLIYGGPYQPGRKRPTRR